MGKESTLHLVLRLRGGKPTVVKMMTNHLACGSEVEIDIEPEESMLSIKKKLEEATGVPVGEQKVMLAGLDELIGRQAHQHQVRQVRDQLHRRHGDLRGGGTVRCAV